MLFHHLLEFLPHLVAFLFDDPVDLLLEVLVCVLVQLCAASEVSQEYVLAQVLGSLPYLPAVIFLNGLLGPSTVAGARFRMSRIGRA